MRYLSWGRGTGVAAGFGTAGSGIVGATRPEAGGTLPRDAHPAGAGRAKPGSTQP
ncbi:hypothetical protein LIG30_3301 [Burkholderia sp. lig30]|jgi:hypothetical protein|uniref:cytochrome bd-I oxidase subunit CydX n=1 Tax=Burkholderia sp. lig30 TaxID=1192124 RepID=UPI0004615B93|nr:cytochrome bd-I oxidase subunit CydX [Burkholderia sp. lig30]KDB07392.1 hypothetical protein LIG30_3301 [Burkholderia sp. lig30]